MEQLHTKQFLLTVSAGKRLIAKAAATLSQVTHALEFGTIAVIAGTTNAYVAEELLLRIGQADDFCKDHFFRGATTMPGKTGPQPNHADVIIEKGQWKKEQTIFDCADRLGGGDIVFKGANAVNLQKRQAGILVGNPTLGTVGPAIQASAGRRAELIVPVGMEKRVTADIMELAVQLNSPTSSGLRFLPVCGTVLTELDAVRQLTGAVAELIAGGGICGAEGSCWIAATGNDQQLKALSGLMERVGKEPSFCKE